VHIFSFPSFLAWIVMRSHASCPCTYRLTKYLLKLNIERGNS
jgi:hypothetical protein